MPDEINIEWKDVEKKVEEDQFRDAKSQQQVQQQQQTNQNQQQQQTHEQKDDHLNLGIADMISGIWNEVAVERGYEPVNEKQQEFLNKHTMRFEDKYLKDRINILPEIDAALAHFTVYVPKYIKHRKETAKSD